MMIIIILILVAAMTFVIKKIYHESMNDDDDMIVYYKRYHIMVIDIIHLDIVSNQLILAYGYSYLYRRYNGLDQCFHWWTLMFVD